MNPHSQHLTTGTFGELLVQLRLLQYGVQAAAPLKDTGNDLIAVRGPVFKAIQVKTTATDRFHLDDMPELYHLAAVVALVGEGHQVDLGLTRNDTTGPVLTGLVTRPAHSAAGPT